MLINRHVPDGFSCDDIPIFPSDDTSHVNVPDVFLCDDPDVFLCDDLPDLFPGDDIPN